MALALSVSLATAGCGGGSWLPKWSLAKSDPSPSTPPDFSQGAVASYPAPGIGTPPEPGRMAKMGQAMSNAGSATVGGIKTAWNKSTGWISSKKQVPEADPNDPVALSGKTPPPGASFHVALARVHERNNNADAATEQYQKALSREPDNLEALLGFARLLDRQNKLQEATHFYEHAARKHPREATVQNDLALCLARQGRTNEALTTLNKAIELQPTRKLYRNNMAKMLVDAGRNDEALQHLGAVHPPAVASYNVGFLLTQKGDNGNAIRYFQRAVELDPNLPEARQWLAYLSQPALPAAGSVPMVASRPAMPGEAGPPGTTTATPVGYAPQPGTPQTNYAPASGYAPVPGYNPAPGYAPPAGTTAPPAYAPGAGYVPNSAPAYTPPTGYAPAPTGTPNAGYAPGASYPPSGAAAAPNGYAAPALPGTGSPTVISAQPMYPPSPTSPATGTAPRYPAYGQ